MESVYFGIGILLMTIWLQMWIISVRLGRIISLLEENEDDE